MGKLETSDIIFGILYASAAIMLLIVSYRLFIRRFKRNKLVAMSEVTLTTSRYDVYKSPTQFLIELSENLHVKLSLLDEDEKELRVISEADMYKGENVVDFDPLYLDEGIYYLYLKTENSSILRKIRIAKD